MRPLVNQSEAPSAMAAATIAGEGVSLQVRAELVIEAVHDGRPLGEVAANGGPLVRSLPALEEQLPESVDPSLGAYLSRMRAILRYEAELLNQSIEQLALSAVGSPRLEEQRAQADRVWTAGGGARGNCQ